MKKKGIIVAFGLLLFFQFLVVAKALPPLSFRQKWPIIPPVCPGDPPAIPDSPFVEGLRLKPPYNLVGRLQLAEAFYSGPESCNWNPAVDLNHDNVVNICDAIIFAKNC